MIIDQGKDLRPYQGITPLAGNTLAECAETFFFQSEQLRSLFRIAISRRTGGDARVTWQGGGLMRQQLPSENRNAVDSDHEDSWERVRVLLDSATTDEMIGPDVSPEQLIVRLFHSENPLISEAFPVAFGCNCSPRTGPPVPLDLFVSRHQYDDKQRRQGDGRLPVLRRALRVRTGHPRFRGTNLTAGTRTRSGPGWADDTTAKPAPGLRTRSSAASGDLAVSPESLRLAVANQRHHPPSSDFDLNPDHGHPPSMRLRKAAVLIPVVFRAEDTTIILTRRHEAMRHHPGQISFSGGQGRGSRRRTGRSCLERILGGDRPPGW